MKAVINVVSKDMVGIIYNVSKILYENKVNILDLSQTVMRDIFTMVMLVELDGASCGFTELSDKLSEMGKRLSLKISISNEEIFNAMHKI